MQETCVQNAALVAIRTIDGRRIDGPQWYEWPSMDEPRARAMRSRLVLLSDVKPDRSGWLWPRRVPYGGLTIIEGDPGTNKSTITNALAAHVTAGQPLPETNGCAGSGGAILLQGEDPLDRTRENLEAAGADLSRILVIDKKAMSSGDWLVLPDDAEFLRTEARRIRARLIVIDPVSVFFGPHLGSDQAVRKTLAPLAAIAEELDAAVVLVRHLTKSGNGNSLYRGMGGIGLIAAARSAMLMAHDPADPEHRVIAQVKTNLVDKNEVESLVFRPYKQNGGLVVEWLGRSNLSADELSEITGGGQRSALEEAIFVLFSILGEGPVLASKAMRVALGAGVASKTVLRAKKVLGVKSQRVGFGPGSKFYWVLPPDEEIVRQLRAKNMDSLTERLFEGADGGEAKDDESDSIQGSEDDS